MDDSNNPRLKTHAAITGSDSAIRKYQSVVVGSRAIGKTLYFEFCSWLAPIPGALGLVLRKVFWPRLFVSCGQGVQFASHIILRHPGRVRLGNNVVLSEHVVLNARNDQLEIVIDVGNDVMMANNVSLSAKNGAITIGNNTGIGAKTMVQSVNDCPVWIGKDNIIGPGSYLVGGSSYNLDQLDVPIRLQGIKPDSGCCLQDNVWIGGKVTVLGGVTMASGSVAAAGAVVVNDIGSNTICGGVPAKTLRIRK